MNELKLAQTKPLVNSFCKYFFYRIKAIKYAPDVPGILVENALDGGGGIRYDFLIPLLLL